MSRSNATLIEQVKITFEHLDKNQLQLLDDIYSPTVVFSDPVHTVYGLPALQRYFAEVYANLNSCTFSYQGQWLDGDSAFLRWQMQFSHPRLRRAQTIRLNGISQLQLHQGKVIKHEDFYDMGAMLYEHLPVMGTLVRTLKKRLQP